MAGFLDKNTRIIDMVLTGEGKFLLSKGDLHFVYFVPFDDEINYTPYLSMSGTLSGSSLKDAICAEIEETPIREATTGYIRYNRSGSDNTNVFRPLFTMPQGQQVLPKMKMIGVPADDFELITRQQKVVDIHIQKDAAGNTLQTIGPFDRGVERFDPSTFTFEIGFAANSYPPEHEFEGVLIRVFKSGSDGLQEVGQRYDLKNDLCYNNDLKMFAGGATTVGG